MDKERAPASKDGERVKENKCFERDCVWCDSNWSPIKKEKIIILKSFESLYGRKLEVLIDFALNESPLCSKYAKMRYREISKWYQNALKQALFKIKKICELHGVSITEEKAILSLQKWKDELPNIKQKIVYTVKDPYKAFSKINLDGLSDKTPISKDKYDHKEEIDDLFSVRTSNALIRGHVYTVKDLLDADANDLIRLHGFGKKSLREVKDFLDKSGIKHTIII